MLLLGDTLPQLFDLQQFAFDHLLREVREHIQNAEVPLLHRDLERLHVQPIAREHALGIAPLSIGCGASTTLVCFVNDVVVNQRRGVDNFHDHSQAHGGTPIASKQFRGKKEQGRTQSLSAAGAQVFTNLGDYADVRQRFLAELTFNRQQVVPQQVKNFFCATRSRSRQTLAFPHPQHH